MEEDLMKEDRRTMGEDIVTRLELLANSYVVVTEGGHEQAQAFANRVSNDQMPATVHAHVPQQGGSQCGLFYLNIVQQVMRMKRTDPLVSDRPSVGWAGMWATPHAGIQAFRTSLRNQFCSAFDPDPTRGT
jgi:hypothetical protein